MRSESRVVWLILVGSLGLAMAIEGQTLGEVAKKEKSRRQTLTRDAKPDRSFTDNDLGVTSRADGDASERDDEAIDATRESESERDDSSSLDSWRRDKEADLEAWRERKAEYQARYDEVKTLLAALWMLKTRCDRDAIPASVGRRGAMSAEQPEIASWEEGPMACEAVPAAIRATLKAMKDIEAECAADARRHFIPAADGRLRK